VANQGRIEIKMEACLEEIKVETLGALEDRTRDNVIPAQRKGHSHKGMTVEKTKGPGTQQWNKGPRCKTAWFRQQPKEFYAGGFQGLVK
jgi:hypothetical protein